MTIKKTILCVEDELKILRNNREALIGAGYNVLTAENLAQARERLANNTVDGIVLDIMLPDGNGLEFLKELRAQGNNIPVLMLTAWNTNADIARGLELGADDYIGKPFGYEVLLSRVKKMLTHAHRVPETVIKGSLQLHITAMTAELNGVDMLLTQKEFALLLLFTQNEDRTMSAEYLYEKVWKASLNDDNRTLKKHISSLRKHLENGDSGYKITNKYGEGYCFEKA